MKKIVLDKTMPRNRNEQEIAGYRDVLNTIHENYDYIPIRATLLLQMHRDLFAIVDVISVLTESKDPVAYWRKLKQRLKAEGNESVTNCHGLKLLSKPS